MEHAIRIIAAFVWNVHLKRAIHEVDASPRINFWRVIYGNFLDMSVIEWCKLFGSDHEENQPAHWKNVVPQDEHEDFRRGLITAVGVDQAEWLRYWQKVKEYRDNHAAHFNVKYLSPENDPHYPDLDLALEAAYFYYERILEVLNDRGEQHGFPCDIREYCHRFLEQATEAATNAVGATTHMREKVR